MSAINSLQTFRNRDDGMTTSNMVRYGATDVDTHWKILGKVRV